MNTAMWDLEETAARLFNDAKLTDLASELNRCLEADEADVRAAFKLATLLAYRGEVAGATKCFAVVREYDWRCLLTENNLAVVYIWAGLTLPGIEKLLAADTETEVPSAVAYNLAVIIDRIADFGSDVPPQLIDCRLIKRGEDLRAKAIGYYNKALQKGRWETGLGGALYLWPEDIPSSTGFPVTLTRPRIEEAHHLLHQAIISTRNREWNVALRQLEQAVATYPSIAKDVRGVKNAALIGLCRQLRTEVKERINEKAFPQAHDRVEELTALYPEIPADDLIRQLLVAEVAEVGEQLLRRKVAVDFSVLQRLSTAAETALNRLEMERAAAAPPVKGEEQADAAWDASGRTAQLLRELCGNSVDEQLRRLVQGARYDEAKTLVEWAKQQWFAQAIQPTWQRDIGRARAQDHLAQARSTLGQGNSVEAERELAIALHAAQEADAQSIIPLIEGELARLQAAKIPRPNVVELQTALSRGEYAQVLAQCAEVLRDYPNDETLLALRASALRLLGQKAHAWARLEDWDQVDKALDGYLAYRPEDGEVQALRARATQGRLDRLVEQAWDHCYRGDRAEAQRLCTDVLNQNPRQSRALELQREMEAAAQRAEAAKNGSDAAARYHTVYLELQEALGNGEAESAFEKACELRRLNPRADHTEDACAKTFDRYVDALRHELETSRTAETTRQVEQKLRRLLNIDPTFAPALHLLADLQRETFKPNADRISACRERLVEAESALNRVDPKGALAALATVFELGVAEFMPKAEQIRDDALRTARQKLKNLIAEAGGTLTSEAEALCKVIGPLSPELEGEIIAFMEQYRDVARAKPLVAKDVDAILDDATASRHQPLRALRIMDRAVRDLLCKYPNIPPAELNRLRELRYRFLKTMPWRQRWLYAPLSWFVGADELYRIENDHH